MPAENEPQIHRYSASIVTQGKHRFHTLTMHSEILTKTCFVTRRDEDPIKGFQRVLDEDRAKQIADYIDNGVGTIPNAIILSAQPESEFKVIRRGGSVEFKGVPKAFLILDGQHRVYGFSLAKSSLRVPVVIYNSLTRVQEARLFIDINTKQRPVSNELLLDIKKLAETETDSEHLFGEVFDLFEKESDSPLVGLMSSSARVSGKISRVTFSAAMKQIMTAFNDTAAQKAYEVLRDYFQACLDGLSAAGVKNTITNPTVFRALALLFPEAAQRVSDKYNGEFSGPNFTVILQPVFEKVRPGAFIKPGQSHRDLHEILHKALRQHFSLGGRS